MIRTNVVVVVLETIEGSSRVLSRQSEAGTKFYRFFNLTDDPLRYSRVPDGHDDDTAVIARPKRKGRRELLRQCGEDNNKCQHQSLAKRHHFFFNLANPAGCLYRENFALRGRVSDRERAVLSDIGGALVLTNSAGFQLDWS